MEERNLMVQVWYFFGDRVWMNEIIKNSCDDRNEKRKDDEDGRLQNDKVDLEEEPYGISSDTKSN